MAYSLIRHRLTFRLHDCITTNKLFQYEKSEKYNFAVILKGFLDFHEQEHGEQISDSQQIAALPNRGGQKKSRRN